jgi:hypothetical protein
VFRRKPKLTKQQQSLLIVLVQRGITDTKDDFADAFVDVQLPEVKAYIEELEAILTKLKEMY